MTQHATVTIPYNDLEEIKNERDRALHGAAELRKELETERLTDKTGKVRELTGVIRTCLDVVRFAIANLPAETTPKWPTTALRQIANAIEVLPDHSADDIEFAALIRGFRKEIAEAEQIRATRAGAPTMLPEQREARIAEATAGLDDGPSA